LVTVTKIVDSLAGENEIRFTDIRLNRPVAGKVFAFQVPHGTPVVSMPVLDPKM
jgi:hypothetical protein